MVKQDKEQLDTIFYALSDPTRREMVRLLATKEHTVTELAAPFDMSLPAVSKHIKVLETAGLLNRTVQGRVHYCRLTPETLVIAQEWLHFYERFWNRQLDALERELNRIEPDT